MLGCVEVPFCLFLVFLAKKLILKSIIYRQQLKFPSYKVVDLGS